MTDRRKNGGTYEMRVLLREHLELQIKYERALTDKQMIYERALTDKQVIASDHAKQLQAGEYERRLSELNHAHAQAMEAQAKTVSRELFDASEREHGKFRETVVADLSKSAGRSAAYAAVLSVAIGVVVIVINLFISLWRR